MPPRRSPRFTNQPTQELKDAPKRKVPPEKREEKKIKRPATALVRQPTLATRLGLPQLEINTFVVDGKTIRSALVFPTLVIKYMQVKDMAQMVRVNKRWRGMCDQEIPVGVLFLCV